MFIFILLAGLFILNGIGSGLGDGDLTGAVAPRGPAARLAAASFRFFSRLFAF